MDIFTRKRCLAGLGRLNVEQNVEKPGHSLISDIQLKTVCQRSARKTAVIFELR